MGFGVGGGIVPGWMKGKKPETAKPTMKTVRAASSHHQLSWFKTGVGTVSLCSITYVVHQCTYTLCCSVRSVPPYRALSL